MNPFIIALAIAQVAAQPVGPSATTATAVAAESTAGALEAAERAVRILNEGKSATAEGNQLLVGELAHLSPGVELPLPDRLLAAAEGAVTRLPASDGTGADLYLYLRRSDRGWKAYAIRTLALGGIVAEMRQLLRQQATRTAEQERDLRNADLTLSSDASLAAWFADHREQLDRARGGVGDAATQAELTRLGLSSFDTRDDMFVASIGGILDNEVGFLFSEKAAPAIDPSHYIWVEPLGGGWYLFKTT